MGSVGIEAGEYCVFEGGGIGVFCGVEIRAVGGTFWGEGEESAGREEGF